MNERGIYRKLVIGGIVLALVLVTAWASASNMGFKLNYGIVNALNRLLKGSGVSFDMVVPPENDLVVNLDLPSLQNSNMGFKLNVTSAPQAGGVIEVEDPDGEVYLLKWDPEAAVGSGLQLEYVPVP